MRCPACHRRLPPGGPCPLHAERPRPAPEPESFALPQVPGFPPRALLGTGGFSRVFTARREEDGREVALKVALGPFAERFAREAAALRRVGPPTVPELLAEGSTPEGRPYLVLERLRGQTLAAWMAALPGSGAAPLSHVRDVLAGLCAALERVHGAGLVHRDLKPENVFLREGGTLSLLDFGLARFLDAADPGEPEASVSLTRTGQRLGTTVYMAPEQCLESRDVDARTDVYALGVLLFELLTGAPPFTGGPDEVLHGHVNLRPPRASERAPVPPALDDVLPRCLAKDKGSRFGSASEVLAAFDAACRSTPGAPTDSPVEALVPARPEGVRGVALLGVRGDLDAEQLTATVVPEGGLLARVHPGLYLVAFPEHPSAEAGLRAAARAARQLPAAPGTTTVLHFAELRVRPGATLTRMAGPALEQPDSWWPHAAEDASLLATPEAAARLGAGATAPGPEGALQLTGDSSLTRAPASAEPPPLLGRDALLDTLLADATRAFSGPGPGFSVLTGEPGHGKTRLLEALAARLEAEGRARVLRLAAPHPDASGAEALLHALWACGNPDAPLPATRPGARRHALARAVAESLRRLAARQPLALLLDDAHQADPTSLDALEVATLAAPEVPLWVCAAGRPELLGLRPLLGERAGHPAQHVLPPLVPEASRALLRHLLRPAEFIPEPVLARLEQLTQGVPLSLVEVAGALRTSGALRASPEGEWYVAADELLHVSVTPLFERLAARALSVLPAAHQGLAQLCAVLGPELTVAQVDAAQRHLEAKEDSARVAGLDAGTGLARLERAGLLRALGPERYAFRQPQLREALERALPAPWRRALHAAALRGLSGGGDAEQRRRARHAAACGAHEESFTAWFSLGESARQAHRSVEAEQHYTHALAQLPEGDAARRARVLAGRGRVRYRIHRFREALADLDAARTLAGALGDTALEVDLLLEEATVLDWLEDAEGTAARTQEALEKAESLDDPRLSVRCSLARARQAWRQGDWARATRLLTATEEAALLARDTETRVIALMMQGTGLALDGQRDAAAGAFDEGLALCRKEGDTLHEAATLINRPFLWRARGDVEAALEDLRRSTALARELGHPQVERWASGNLAEFLHWMGQTQEAYRLARRAHELGVRFFGEHPVAVDAVLLARVCAARGEWEEARGLLDWLSAHCRSGLVPPNTLALWRLVELQVREGRGGGREAGAWTALAGESQPNTSADELTEVLHQAALSALRSGERDEARDWLTRAESTAADSPLWRPRLEALREALLVAAQATPLPLRP